MPARIAEKTLVFLLRFLGVNALLAFAFVPMPFSLFQKFHEKLGLGAMPDVPIVGYLTRSLCLFYTIFGVILITVSFDLKRYRRLLWMIGILLLLIGFTLLGIDWHQELPLSWTLSEGPFTIVIGAIFLYIMRIWECGKS